MSNETMPILPSLKREFKKKEADPRLFRTPIKDPKKQNDTNPEKYEAVVRLLPLQDESQSPVYIQEYYDISWNGKKMFCLVGADKKTDPVAVTRAALYAREDRDNAKKFFPKRRIFCNIEVVKDPLHPEREGKVMLWSMPATIYKMAQDAMNPVANASLVDDEAMEAFNPFSTTKGHDLHLVVTRGDNGYPDYSKSKFLKKVRSLGKPEQVTKIMSDVNDLKEFNKFETNEVIQTRLNQLLGTGLDTAPVAAPVSVVAPIAPPVMGNAADIFKTPQKVDVASATSALQAPADDESDSEDSLPF